MLAHKPDSHLGMGDIKVTQAYLVDLLAKAIVKEKEQIIDAYLEGLEESVIMVVGMETKHAEWYYRDTYEQ